MSVFGSENVIAEHISEADLKAYFVGFDFGKWRKDELIDVLMDALVDFTFGYHKGVLKDSYNRRILKEAAESLYKIEVFEEAKKTYVNNDSEYKDNEKKFLKRGEFGELILHLILRDFIITIPLISKIYFKDSDGMTVHGFDAVHIGKDLNNVDADSIFLGESKLYNNGVTGVKALVEDIESHFTRDFLKREFTLIGKKREAFLKLEEFTNSSNLEEYERFLEEKDKWFDKLDEVTTRNGKLEELFQSVTIPLLCTYTSNVFSKYNQENEDFKREYEGEIKKLKEIFDNRLNQLKDKYNNSGEPIQSDLNIVIMLFPVPSKKELVKELHKRLLNIQGI